MTAKNPVTYQEALERFKETHPNLNTVKKIAEFGDEHAFVQRYGPQLAGRDREARQVYRRAVNLQERAVLLWGNIRDAVSPFFSQTLFNNLPQDLPAAFIEQQESIPGYNRLFGNLDFIECDHHRSIFGPAAYFVDLMRFVEQNITQKNAEIPRWCALEARRPDLARIQLDADNTSDLIPYIDLVNELLEAFVKTVGVADGDAYEVIKAEIFPMSLPFDLPLAEIRSYLKQLKTSLHQIYQTFKPLEDRDNSTIKRLLTQESLALSPEAVGLIVSEISQPADLYRHYGDDALELKGSEGLENVDVFLAQTGLTRQQLNELLFQDLDRHEVNAGLSRLFFINNVSDGLAYLTIAPNTNDADHPFDQLFNLSHQKLDRIYRFLRLARQLDWSFADLDWALRSQAPAYIAETALLFDGINDYVACGASKLTDKPFTVEAWINPSRAGRHVILSKGRQADHQLHFMLWIDGDDNRLAFYGGRTTGDPFKMKSVYPIPTDAFTHVAVVVAEKTVRFYINGRPDQGDTLTPPLAAVGEDLNLGCGLAGECFAGVIKEVRIWEGARTLHAISDNRYRRFSGQTQGLIGYWPLIETVDGVLTDLSAQGNHGRLGGEGFVTQPRWVRRDLVLDPFPQAQASVEAPQDYAPQPVAAVRPLPEPPIATRARVLDLDGDNDVLVIKNEKNWGLGRLDRWTLEFWFNATNRKKLENRKQVLFTQGDAEAGLSIYLFKHRLYVLQWCNNFEQTEFRSSLLRQPTPITYGPWHHLAITHDEFPATATPLPLDVVEFRALLDGTALIAADEAEVTPGFRLSPVGAVCLGGLAKGMVTRFEDAYAQPGKEDQHFFAGQIAELRLWRTVKSAPELMRDRIISPMINPDLLAYLPLDEGDGWLVSDRAGQQHGNRYMGTLQQRQIALQTTHTDTELVNIYSHYDRPEALAWKDYCYAGRLRMVNEKDAVGVTFLSRHPDGTDQYYRLGRDADLPTFHLVAHPAGVQTLKSADPESDKTVSTVQPQANVWYHFLIQVEDTGTQTAIRAKIWPAGQDEPTHFQIEAYDDNPDVRITSGTVGVWTLGSSTQSRQFDNLCVWPTAITNPTPADLWLDINFEAQSQLPEPKNWRDTGDRIIPLGDNRLFSQLEINDSPGGLVWGTDSTLVNIHAHYQSPDVDTLTWQDYTYDGQMRITEANSGIGVTVLSRHPEAIDQYYSLRRDADHPSFYLTAHPHGVQPMRSLGPQDQIDSGIVPLPNIWYRFYVQVVSDPVENRTEIRAKVWEVGAPEPPAFQMVAVDDSSIRLRSGTVGVWATGPGSKYFDQLRVIQDLLLSESFETDAPDQDPLNWRDTAKKNSREEDPALFKTALIGNVPAYGTRSTDTNIHSHFVAPGVLDWGNYVYTGRLYITKSDAGIGVTFLSRYADETVEAGEHDYYYRLRCNSKKPTFHISPHRGNGKTPDKLIKGRADSRINPTSNTWYRFHIEVEDTKERTQIRANVWPDSLPEPAGFQIDAYDDADDRLTTGTVGLWALGKGAKYFDDLQVFQGLLLSARVNPEAWTDAPSRDHHEPNDTLFGAIDTQDNQLQWKTLNTFPLLRRPLSQIALQFDGQRQSLAGVLEPPLSLTDFSVEAWVKPDPAKPNPILSIGGISNDGISNTTSLEFGLNPQGQPTFIAAGETLAGTTPISPDQFVHIAVRVQGSAVTFLVDGQAEATALALPAPFDLQITGLEMGRSGETSPQNAPGQDFADHYFSGQIKEVRLWNTARTDEQIAAGRYQRPETSAALIGYWSLGEDTSDQIPLTPIIPVGPAPIGIDLPDTGFWRAQRQVLTFNGVQSVRYADPDPPVDRHQRTIEVWFQVVDKTVAQRKQVIYHEGDGQRGILLYAYDSELYFVGYNTPANESEWQIAHEENWRINPVDLRRVWRLKTDRIESGRWHHAAIVLDGRDEVRPTSLRGYLDGKFVVAGSGAKLWQHKTDFGLGGVRGTIRFHDGQSYDGTLTGTPGHTLNGGILKVRQWNRACTAREIEDNWSQDLTAPPPDLDLLWNLDDATGTQILDTSGQDRGGSFEHPEQLQTLRQSLQALPVYALTPVTLDETALGRIADIKRLKEGHNLSIDQVTALWYSLKHVGYEDGIPLFDRVFNSQGVKTERWNYHLDRPLRWDRAGQENRSRDRQTRSKLMESLKVSSQDLDALVTYLSGDETILEMDTVYLTRLYRLARLPRLLRLTVPEFLVLLTTMNQSHKNQASIETLADVLVLSDRAAWMQRTGISVAELIFFSKAVATAHTDLYAATDLRTLAKQLREQAEGILVNAESFTTTEITEAQSLAIFQFLQDGGWVEVINAAELGDLSPIQKQVQALAAVRPDPAPSDLSGLLEHLATIENWMGEFDTLKAELDGLRTGLGQKVLDALIAQNLITSSGLVYRQQPDSFSDENLLQALPSRDRRKSAILEKRTRIRGWLAQRVARQDQIESTVHATLTRLREAMQDAILQGLADMFEISIDLVSVVVGYLKNNQPRENAVDAVAFIKQIHTLQAADTPIPPSLSVYLARSVKLTYLLAKFEFNLAEARAFLAHPEVLLMPAKGSSSLAPSDLLQPSLANLDRLAHFQQLKTAFNDETAQLIGVLGVGAIDLSALSANDPKVRQLSDLTGWQPRQLIRLAVALGGSNHNRVEVLNRLHLAFNLARSMGSDVDFLMQLSNTDRLDFAFYHQQATALLKVLRSNYNEDDWAKIYKPIRNQLAVQKRDALLALAMRQLPDDFAGRQDPDILYEYFLLDMQMGSEVETSRIVQATAGLQLYVQRCLMNLEAGVDPDTISIKEWEWVKNYRVWEANRKVFLYPENYIEPELRRTKTPLFEELEQNLLQADINQAAVEKAYITYLDQFADLAKLKIVGSYLHRELPGDPHPGDETLYLVGRTDTQPRIYYLRRHVKTRQGERWLPWEKIDVAINSDFATPVYAFGKLLLFWTEFTKLKESQDQRLSQQIRAKYSTDVLKSVFKDPQITPDDVQKIERMANYTRSYNTDRRLIPKLSELGDSIPNAAHFTYLFNDYTDALFAIIPLVKSGIVRSLYQFRQSVARAQKEIGARRELEAALTPEEITRLERREWTIDSGGYLFDNRIVGRVQKNADVYKTAVKYTYYNFGKTWIPPQTHLEKQLSETKYQQIKWHSLYAQRAYQFVPAAGSQSPQQEPNPQVLQIDENTQLAVILPRFNMERLTGSFWLKLINVSPQGHKGSIATDLKNPLNNRKAVTKEALTQSLTLLNYDNGALQITAKNDVDEIPGAQTREDNVRAAESLTDAALELSKQNNFEGASLKLAKIQPTPIEKIPEAIDKTNIAIKAQDDAAAARSEATKAREAANAVSADSPDKKALDNAATQKESAANQKEQAVPARQDDAKEAIEAAHDTAEKQLLVEVDEPKWQSKTLKLTVQLGDLDEILTTTLAMDVWQHVALIFEKKVENGVDGYQIKLIQHPQSGAEPETTQFLKSVRLAQRELLEIGRQTVANPIFSTQMAEFQLWSELRPKTTIQAERLHRKASEAGVFSLPLNARVPSSNMTLVPARGLVFTIPIAFQGELSSHLAEDRERIIIFYGDEIRSIRNNLEEQGFDLTLDRRTTAKNYDVSLQSHNPTEAVLSLTQTDGLFVSDFASTDNTSILALPEPTTDTQSFIIRKLQSREVSFLDVHNRPGWYIVDTGDDQFLVKAIFLDAAGEELPVLTAAELMRVQFNNAANTSNNGAQAISVSFGPQDNQAPVVAAITKVEFQFERLSTYAIHQLSQNLFAGGIDKFLSPASQRTQEIDFWQVYEPNANYVPRNRNQIPAQIDFQGSYRGYYEEIFLHIPFLIANQLNANQQFADAQKWYHYIFNPTATSYSFNIDSQFINALNKGGLPEDALRKAFQTQGRPLTDKAKVTVEEAGIRWKIDDSTQYFIRNENQKLHVQLTSNPNDRYWQYLPFQNQTPQRLLEVLTQPEALTVYRQDPFDPHAIAALRLTTYQKAIVMKYIDNLLDWGDSLFTQDTRESITEASMLYVLAFNLLGPRPKAKPLKHLEEIGTYNDFVENYEDTIEFLTDLEKTTPAGSSTAISLSPYAHLITHFCVPENEKFMGYWDLVEDRLYKIRHSLNIEGIFRQLALFQPPIDPAALVKAVAGGAGIGGALADLNVSVPHYRYSKVLEQAKDVISMVSDLGSALLSALEAKDDGRLTLLQHTHERNLLNLITTLKEYELSEAKEELEALKINRQNIAARKEYYRGLVEDGTAGLSLSAAETSAITFKNIVRGLQLGSGITKTAAKMAKVIPDFGAGISGFGGSPYVTTWAGGIQVSAVLEAQAEIVGSVADGLDIAAEMSQEIGAYQRRYQEWQQDKRTADFDLQEIDQQIAIAKIHLQRTEFEQSIHEKEIQQNQEVADFYRTKFTNGELRTWMVGRLSGLYFQAYKLAYDLAKAAEKALQFELPTTQTFITPGHWDSLRKGLLAGESLMLELNRMDKVHLDQDSRFQDIEKTISMKRTFPEALGILKQTGACELSLGEQLFDLDFAGHYCRLVKTMAISIVAGGKIDPYDAVHATLNQTGNKTLLVPDSDAVGYLMGLGDEQPDTGTLRVNWRANQQIAISKPSEDLGMFNLDFIFDDRYFPFEGTGAVSTWRLEMPHENNPALVDRNAKQLQITDVIIHLRYTAKVDRGVFKQKVQELMTQL